MGLAPRGSPAGGTNAEMASLSRCEGEVQVSLLTFSKHLPVVSLILTFFFVSVDLDFSSFLFNFFSRMTLQFLLLGAFS